MSSSAAKDRSSIRNTILRRTSFRQMQHESSHRGLSSLLTEASWLDASTKQSPTKQYRRSGKARRSSQASVVSNASSAVDQGNTNVYVRDAVYAWLPAHVLSANPIEGSAVVKIVLPEDWTLCTVLRKESTVQQLEYETGFPLATAGGFLTGQRQKFQSRDGRYGYDIHAQTPTGITRTVFLTDYPNQELPLQNLQRTATYSGGNGSVHSSTSSFIAGKDVQMVVSDMADLPFLHEAAILYNLKSRHFSSLPYTRVGDIVVSVNPFQWIDGLYSEQQQEVYANHLIWNLNESPPPSNDEDDDDDVGSDESINNDTLGALPGTEKDLFLHPMASGSNYSRLGFQPHVYETSSLAYRGLAVNRQNQTILVSGEAGSGKTETVKIIMSHLATVERSRPFYKFIARNGEGEEGAEETVKRVLESNPVFEAFGNAKTLRNDNSSRFGKFTQLQFNIGATAIDGPDGSSVPSCILAGSRCITYLLEKSRVVFHDVKNGERTYHILYQLLSAPEKDKRTIWARGLSNTTLDSFRYVGDSETRAIEGKSDTESWANTVEALKVFGVEGNEYVVLMRALCTVLQLGNIYFEPQPNNEADCCCVSSLDELELLSDLMGVESNDISRALTKRVSLIRGEEMILNLNVGSAHDGCDALAKEIYARIFDVLVRKINEYTAAENRYPQDQEFHKFGIIGLLDIFGFERFDVNRFEQLCINYANERLQQRYVLDNFKAVQQEYEEEGIEIFDFTMVDNSDVLTLLEGKMGLIVSLNEECIRPKGSDESFVYKAKMVHSDSSNMLTDRFHKPSEFGVKHFAGPVTYDATDFISRNTDLVPKVLLECAAKSTNKLIGQEFTLLVQTEKNAAANGKTPRRSAVATKRTVLAKFRSQLTSLMEVIECTRTRYIRCIKPNSNRLPKKLDHWTTMKQLECAGLVTAITISRESFPNRLPYDVTWDRFHCLWDDAGDRSLVLRDNVEANLFKLLNKSVARADGSMVLPFACGKTKVYFRSGALERLETERMTYYSARATKIQNWIRRVMAQSKFTSLKRAVILLQAQHRMRTQWRKHNKRKLAAIVLQCFVRCTFARLELVWHQESKAATLVQTRWRVVNPSRSFCLYKGSASKIQRAFRQRRNQSNFTAQIAVFVEEARMDHKLSNLQQQVADEYSIAGEQKNMDENLLEEIESMFGYLRKEIFTLRKKNTELGSEIKDLEEDKRELVRQTQSLEASGNLSKLRSHQLNKTNSALIAEVKGRKKENAELKRQLKAQEEKHRHEITGVHREFEQILGDRAMEMAVLKDTLNTERDTQREEVELLQHEIEVIREENLEEVLRLKNELRKTQDSHHDYLAKLMDVLETSHAAREAETTRLNQELDQIRKDKDSEIRKLQHELTSFRSAHAEQNHDVADTLKQKHREVVALRKDMSSRTRRREERAMKFAVLSDELETHISVHHSGDAHENSGKGSSSSILRRNKARKPIVEEGSRSEEGTYRLKQIIRSLQELYRAEERSHQEVDLETIQMIDEVVNVSQNNVAVKNLQEALTEVQTENKELRGVIMAKSFACRACGFRSGRSLGHRTKFS